MNLIVDHIEYLLRKHDCVIIPGWGAFIAQYESAKFDDGRGDVVPPKRKCVYNGSLTFSDGLLENSIMRKDCCSYSVASDRIRECVDAMRNQLDADGELAFGRLGVFSKNDEDELTFAPCDCQNVLNDYFGLNKFRALTLDALSQRGIGKRLYDESDEECEPLSDENDIRRKIMSVIFNKEYLHLAASVVALIIISFVLMTPIPVDKQSVNKASMDDSFRIRENVRSMNQMDVHKELAVMLPPSAMRELAQNHAEHDLSINNDNEENAENTDNRVEDSENKVVSRFEGDNYCLVVASAYSRREAVRFINRKNSGDELRIYKTRDGKYRVYVASGNSCNRMLEVRKELKSVYPDAWVCVR